MLWNCFPAADSKEDMAANKVATDNREATVSRPSQDNTASPEDTASLLSQEGMASPVTDNQVMCSQGPEPEPMVNQGQEPMDSQVREVNGDSPASRDNRVSQDSKAANGDSQLSQDKGNGASNQVNQDNQDSKEVSGDNLNKNGDVMWRILLAIIKWNIIFDHYNNFKRSS